MDKNLTMAEAAKLYAGDTLVKAVGEVYKNVEKRIGAAEEIENMRKGNPISKGLSKEIDLLLVRYKDEKDPHEKYSIAVEREKLVDAFYWDRIKGESNG